MLTFVEVILVFGKKTNLSLTLNLDYDETGSINLFKFFDVFFKINEFFLLDTGTHNKLSILSHHDVLCVANRLYCIKLFSIDSIFNFFRASIFLIKLILYFNATHYHFGHQSKCNYFPSLPFGNNFVCLKQPHV